MGVDELEATDGTLTMLGRVLLVIDVVLLVVDVELLVVDVVLTVTVVIGLMLNEGGLAIALGVEVRLVVTGAAVAEPDVATQGMVSIYTGVHWPPIAWS